MNANQLVLLPQHSILIYRFSFVALITISNAFYNKHYDFCILSSILFFNTLNYWRNPNANSYRRYVDISGVIVGLIYQCIRAYNTSQSKLYYNLTSFAAFFYPLGYFFHNKKNYLLSTYCHIVLHLLVNISCIALYSSNLDKHIF